MNQIWESLDRAGRRKLYEEIIVGTRTTEQTFRLWVRGKKSPKSYNTQEKIAECVKAVTGIETTPEVLFPEKL